MGFLKSGTFWGGVIVGLLLCSFVPALNIRSKMSGGMG